MAKEEMLEFDGTVTEVLPDGNFRVKLDNDHEILAYTAGKMRKFRIRTGVGDRVIVEMSPYDLSRGRISFRHRGNAMAAPPTRQADIRPQAVAKDSDPRQIGRWSDAKVRWQTSEGSQSSPSFADRSVPSSVLTAARADLAATRQAQGGLHPQRTRRRSGRAAQADDRARRGLRESARLSAGAQGKQDPDPAAPAIHP